MCICYKTQKGKKIKSLIVLILEKIISEGQFPISFKWTENEYMKQKQKKKVVVCSAA